MGACASTTAAASAAPLAAAPAAPAAAASESRGGTNNCNAIATCSSDALGRSARACTCNDNLPESAPGRGGADRSCSTTCSGINNEEAAPSSTKTRQTADSGDAADAGREGTAVAAAAAAAVGASCPFGSSGGVEGGGTRSASGASNNTCTSALTRAQKEAPNDEKRLPTTKTPAASGGAKTRTVHNVNSRGGGGVCPFSGARSLEVLASSLDVTDLANLGRVRSKNDHDGNDDEGGGRGGGSGRKEKAEKRRHLTSIPDGCRLELTGIRFDCLAARRSSNLDERGESIRAFRGTAYAVSAKNKKKGNGNGQLRTIELSKRSEPSWNGLHLRLEDDEALVVEIQERKHATCTSSTDDAPSSWSPSFAQPVRIHPLQAFTVPDQDVAWLRTRVHPDFDRSDIVFTELTLTRRTNALLAATKGADIASRQRQKPLLATAAEFEFRKRGPAEVAADEALLASLVGTPDPMTPQDRVAMKDVWNKCLGWIGMTGEHFVECLFLRCPDLLQILGATPSELAYDMLVSVVDMAVRNLDRKTEVVARESYAASPLRGDVEPPFRTLEEGFQQFAQLGMRPRHWKEAQALFLLTMSRVNPYLEENDAELLAQGTNSCAYRFWTYHVMKPAMLAIKAVDDIFESEENRQMLQESFQPLAADKVRSGVLFYRKLFRRYPEVLPYFGRTDMDFLSSHLFDAVELLVSVFNDFDKALPVLRHLGKIHDNKRIPVFTYAAIGDVLDATLREAVPGYGDGTPKGEALAKLWLALVNRTVLITTRISFVSERLLHKAFEWSEQCKEELKWSDAYLAKRKIDIETEIRTRGTYTHTEEEIVHGARVSWRNSAKCVGRISWNTLLVRDRRHVTNLDHMSAECLEHQRLATADGSLKAVMTVFRPRQPGTRMGQRFWNAQLVRFACYENEDGTLMGDGANKQYTDEVISFGWKPPVPRTEFDVLPIVIEDPITGTTKMFELQKEYHKVTMITHPKYPEFDKLRLRWCVVPTVTSFTLRLGGLEYTCCPFNGWFMESEITRDLLEAGRMNKMEAIARAIGVDPTDEDGFWREHVMLETNKAVMHSFRRDGHSIVDHVTAQSQFLAHYMREKKLGREVPAQWSWVVPAAGGSTMPIWHHEMRDFYVEPQYDYQAEIFAVRKESSVPEDELLASADDDAMCFEKILILHGSTTGTAEGYAYQAKKMLRPLRVTVASCEQYNPKELLSDFLVGGGEYSAVLFITSTFGEGNPPPSAEAFFTLLKTLSNDDLAGIPFAVMGICSTVYPDYCQAGIDLDKALTAAGGKQIFPLAKGDEVNGSVLQWISSIGSIFDLQQKKALVASGDSEDAAEVDPVTVSLLGDDDNKVVAAIDEEKRLVPNDPSAGAVARYLANGYKLCRVAMNDELVSFPDEESKRMFRSTRFLEFDLNGICGEKEASDLVYETGDHARIMPMNDPSLVLEMCRCLDIRPNQWVDITIEDGPSLPASTMRVGDLFALELDLATQQDDGNVPLLDRLVNVARASSDETEAAVKETEALEAILEKIVESADLATEEEKGTSKALIREEARKKAVRSLTESFVTIPSLLSEYPVTTSKLGLADVVEVLPRLKPRFYSIASSSEMLPTKLQLSVGKLTITHKSTDKFRNGVSSHFLARSTPAQVSGEAVEPKVGDDDIVADVPSAGARVYVRMGITKSTFRLPKDYSSPVIMIGPGTGIAPMLGFLQAREHAKSEGVTLGPCMVFFGCPAENDFLHSARMRKWADDGIITDLQVAFSRLQDKPKEYVQNVVARRRSEVWALLSDPACHYYICGDSQMAEDVFAELRATSIAGGGLDHIGSVDFFRKMKDERRFQADTWGVVAKRDVALKNLVEKKYNQAEAWLDTVEDEKKEDA